MPSSLLSVCLVALLATGCVDGTTPDCSYVDSGCFVGPDTGAADTGADTGSQADASDASSDVSPVDGADAAGD